MEKEQTHQMKIQMDANNDVQLFILLTISGTYFLNTVVDMDDYLNTQDNINNIKQKFVSIFVNT